MIINKKLHELEFINNQPYQGCLEIKKRFG